MLNPVVANILSLALLASLSTIIGIALYQAPYRKYTKYVGDPKAGTPKIFHVIYRLIDWMSWTMFFLAFLIIIISLLLSFYLVLSTWIIAIIDSVIKCAEFSIAEILKAADILPIVLHGCISIGIGIAFIWATLKHKYHNEFIIGSEYSYAHAPVYACAYKVLNGMIWAILFMTFFLIAISLLLALWSSIMFFNVDILKGLDESVSNSTYQYSWCK